MRIRKRLPPPSSALSDPLIHRSEAAQPSINHYPHQIAVISSNNVNGWDLPKNDTTQEKMKQKDSANVETLKDAKASSSSSSSPREEYTTVPLKMRKRTFHINQNEKTMSAKMKSKTNKKCGDISQDERKEKNGSTKKGNVVMEGSRCSRVNGRGWRCSRTTLVGYSLCEHHLRKGRLMRSMASTADGALQALMVTKKRTKVGHVVKARSISSLLAQI